MMRVVVRQRGNEYQVYRGKSRLGEVHRLPAERHGSVWLWRASLARDAAGREQSLGDALDAIEQACDQQTR